MSPRPGWLGEALRELAQADAAAEAPARVEQSLRAAFLAHAAEAGRAKSGPGRRRAATWWVAAAAAALALWSTLLPREPAPSTDDEPAFRPLSEGETWAGLDAVQIVRVRLTGAALAEFGGPVGAGAPASVDAEVILGQDGVARAIRIVE